jgi:soluble lytic murein transglycosylase-like protein
MPVFVCLATVAIVAWADHASAQIYAWRDSTGTLVLSDRRLDSGAITYSVPDAPTVRTTRAITPNAAYERFEPLVQEHATRTGIRPDLVRAVIQVESAFNPRATSPKGAMGLMQLMPATARDLGVVNPYDPADNIRGGTSYLRQLLDRYGGDEQLALAAYNAGFKNVDRYGGQVPPYQETQAYVRKVGAVADLERPPSSPGVPARGKRVIYKIVNIVDGRPVIQYTTERPMQGSYEIVQR